MGTRDRPVRGCVGTRASRILAAASKHHKIERGFSLIEIVVALGLLATGLIGVVRLFPVGLRASKRSEVISKAALLAQQQLEELKLRGYAALAADPPDAPLSGSAGTYQWAVAVASVDAVGLPTPNDLRAVTVTVQWPEGKQTRSTVVTTYVAP